MAMRYGALTLVVTLRFAGWIALITALEHFSFRHPLQ